MLSLRWGATSCQLLSLSAAEDASPGMCTTSLPHLAVREACTAGMRVMPHRSSCALHFEAYLICIHGNRSLYP